MKDKKTSILYEREINEFLIKHFRESWMDDNDWQMFLETLEKDSRISIKTLSSNLVDGLKNGHSIEKQFGVLGHIINSINK